jgi:hypothetical protein
MLALSLNREPIAAVDIFFKNTKLAKVLSEEARLLKAYGARNARQIRLRLAVLAASVTEIWSRVVDRPSA